MMTTPTSVTLAFRENDARGADSGFILVAVLALILPLVILVGSFSSTMSGRNSRLLREIRDERALLAAEAGVDESIYLGNLGMLVSGSAFTADIGEGMSADVLPVHLGSDGVDNDGDSVVDEADEDVFQLIVTGRYAGSIRRVAVYLGPRPPLPAAESAWIVDAPPVIAMTTSEGISGIDTNMDGSPGDPSKDLPGIVIAPPRTTGQVVAQLDPVLEAPLVTGSTPTPSVDLATGSPDIQALAWGYRNTATHVFTEDKVNNEIYGDASKNDYRVLFRDGDLKFQGTSGGAGVLVVTGNLKVLNNFRFDGVIIVLGTLQLNAASTVYGAVIQGPTTGSLEMHGSSKIQYSGEALDEVDKYLVSGYVLFNGWQEISRN